MYQKIFSLSRFYPLLRKLDQELALETKRGGCPCGGKLHYARYPRKPRGTIVENDMAYRKRESFCCAEEGCRRRTTPPSVLFLGRKVFFSVVVILVCVLRQGPKPTRLDKLGELTGASARTIRRWQKWWKSTFVQSECWRAGRGRFSKPVDVSELPRSLLQAFAATGRGRLKRLVHMLRFMGPLSTTSTSVEQIF